MSEVRQQILTTAAALFEERGYELVGINEIIAKAAVAKATFYAHFKSKETLCAEWLKADAAESEAAAAALLREPIPVAEKVARKFDELRKWVKASNFRGCPFSITASMTDPSSEVREVIRDYKASARAFWQSLALEIHRDPASARGLGDTWFLLYSGAVSEAQNVRSLWPLDSARAAALALCSSPPS